MEIEGTCQEYLDLLFTQGFGAEVGNRLMAAIRTIFPRYSRQGDLDMPRTVKALKKNIGMFPGPGDFEGKVARKPRRSLDGSTVA